MYIYLYEGLIFMGLYVGTGTIPTKSPWGLVKQRDVFFPQGTIEKPCVPVILSLRPSSISFTIEWLVVVVVVDDGG